MKRTAAYRVTAEICFFFSILSIFPVMQPWQTPMAIFTVACLAVSLAAVYCPWWPLRLLLSLLPGLAFIKAELSLLLIFPAFAWLYLIIVLTAGHFNAWLDEYRRAYRIMLVVCLCALAANVAHNAIYRGALISLPGLFYALAFLCLGVLAMRGMQMNAERPGASWTLNNVLTVVGLPLLAIGGSTLLYVLLRSVKPVVALLFRPIGQFFLWLFGLIFPEDMPVATPTPTPLYTDPPYVGFQGPAGHEGRAVLEDNIEPNFVVDPMLTEKAAQVGGYIVFVLLLLAAIWLVAQYARRSRRARAEQDYTYAETEDDAPQDKRRSGRMAQDPNARALRKIYKDYLELMRSRGIRIRQDTTSRDVLDESEQYNLSEAARRLRELYLKARYAEEDAVSPEEVAEARRCLQQIREECKA